MGQTFLESAEAWSDALDPAERAAEPPRVVRAFVRETPVRTMAHVDALLALRRNAVGRPVISQRPRRTPLQLSRPEVAMPARHSLPESCLPPPAGERPSPARASLVLLDGDVLVAWIAGRALGFGGFADERAAARAAWTAQVALSRWIAHRGREAPPLPAAPRLHVAGDAGDGEQWVLADQLPIARLVDPREVRISDAGEEALDAISGRRARTARDRPATPDAGAYPYSDEREVAPGRGNDAGGAAEAYVGFEIAVPLPVGELGVRGAAYAVYRALCRAGLPWRLWNAGKHARRVSAFGGDAARDPALSTTGARRGPSRASAPAVRGTSDHRALGGVDR